MNSVGIQAAMQHRAKQRVLRESSWLTLAELADLVVKEGGDAASLILSWRDQNRLFSILHDGVEYFPLYVFDDRASYEPWPALKSVIGAFGGNVSGWRLAFWFDSPNSYLDGLQPLEMIATNPADVILAAEREASGILHG